MPTLMRRQTFQHLVEARGQIDQNIGGVSRGRPSKVFVPWSGDRLIEGQGIYYVGIAIDAEESHEQPTFENCLTETEQFCISGRHSRDHSPFWRFLNGLTEELIGGPYHETADLWGWSNLLKIGWSTGSPSTWPAELKTYQRDLCICSLQEEFARLRRCLVFIGSYEDFGIIYQTLPAKDRWNREHEGTAGIWWYRDPKSESLFVHGYHPRPARTHGFFDNALRHTVELTREHVPGFGRRDGR